MMYKVIYLVFFLLFATSVQASISNTSLSKVVIEKDLGFKGMDITVQGEKNPEEEVAILAYGPFKSYNIIKKEKFYGMWLNNKHFTLPLVQSYYRMASSKELSRITDEETLKFLGFKLNDNDCVAEESASPQETHDFCNAFYKYKVNSGLYQTNSMTLFITGKNHFKGTFNVPQTAPTGIYHINVFSFDKSGKLTDKTHLYFLMRNGKVFQTLSDFAINYPLTHSLLAITFALMIGALVGFLFNGKQPGKNKKSDYPAQ